MNNTLNATQMSHNIIMVRWLITTVLAHLRLVPKTCTASQLARLAEITDELQKADGELETVELDNDSEKRVHFILYGASADPDLLSGYSERTPTTESIIANCKRQLADSDKYLNEALSQSDHSVNAIRMATKHCHKAIAMLKNSLPTEPNNDQQRTFPSSSKNK